MFFSVEKNILEIFLSVTQTMENKCGECDCKRRIIFLKFPWLLDTYFWNSWHVSALYKYSVIQILICSSRTFCHFLHLTLNTAVFTHGYQQTHYSQSYSIFCYQVWQDYMAFLFNITTIVYIKHWWLIFLLDFCTLRDKVVLFHTHGILPFNLHYF